MAAASAEPVALVMPRFYGAAANDWLTASAASSAAAAWSSRRSEALTSSEAAATLCNDCVPLQSCCAKVFTKMVVEAFL